MGPFSLIFLLSPLALCQQTFQQFRFDLDPNLPAEEPAVLSQLEERPIHVDKAQKAVKPPQNKAALVPPRPPVLRPPQPLAVPPHTQVPPPPSPLAPVPLQPQIVPPQPGLVPQQVQPQLAQQQVTPSQFGGPIQQPQQFSGFPQQNQFQNQPQKFSGFPQQNQFQNQQMVAFPPQGFNAQGVQPQFLQQPFAQPQPLNIPQSVGTIVAPGQIPHPQPPPFLPPLPQQPFQQPQPLGFGSQLAATQQQTFTQPPHQQQTFTQPPPRPQVAEAKSVPIPVAKTAPAQSVAAPSRIPRPEQNDHKVQEEEEAVVVTPIMETPASSAMWFRDEFDTTECRSKLSSMGQLFRGKFPSSIASRHKDAALADLVQERLLECDKKGAAGHWDRVDQLLGRITLSKSEEAECRGGLVQERISCYNLLSFGCQFVSPRFQFRLVPARIVIQEARQAENGAQKCHNVVRIVKQRLEG